MGRERLLPTQQVGDGEKWCSGCSKVWPATKCYFYRNQASPDKLSSYCKSCGKLYSTGVTPPAVKARRYETDKWCKYCQSHHPKTNGFWVSASGECRTKHRERCRKTMSHIRDVRDPLLSPRREKRQKRRIVKTLIDLLKGRLALLTVGQKRCSACQQWKPANNDNFHRDNKRRSGWQSQCRQCRSKRSKRKP